MQRLRVVATSVLTALILASLSISVGCGKSRQLVGTWTLSNFACGPVTLTFFKDGTGMVNILGEAQSFTWEVKGDYLLLRSGQETEKFKFKVEKNTLILYPVKGKIKGEEIDSPLVFVRVAE